MGIILDGSSQKTTTKKSKNFAVEIDQEEDVLLDDDENQSDLNESLNNSFT